MEARGEPPSPTAFSPGFESAVPSVWAAETVWTFWKREILCSLMVVKKLLLKYSQGSPSNFPCQFLTSKLIYTLLHVSLSAPHVTSLAAEICCLSPSKRTLKIFVCLPYYCFSFYTHCQFDRAAYNAEPHFVNVFVILNSVRLIALPPLEFAFPLFVECRKIKIFALN